METNLLFLVLFVGYNTVLLFGEVVNCIKTNLEDIPLATIEEAYTSENGSVVIAGYEGEFSFNSLVNCSKPDLEDNLFGTIEETDTTENSSVVITDYEVVFSSNTTNKNMSNSSPPAPVNDLVVKWQALNLSDACRETAERMKLLDISDSGCGGVLVDLENEFYSFSTPKECKWLVCNDYDRYFRFFAGLMSRECDKYYFDVCDGCQFNENGSHLEKGTRHKFCGKPHLSEFVSSNQIIVVEYKMPRRFSHWHLGSYQLLKQKPDCVLTSYAENGTIVSPEYPGSYPAWISCTWTIIAPMAHKIIITAIDFHMQNQSLCPGAETFLQIWDGTSEEYPMIVRFNEKNPFPSTFISNSNSVRISSRPRFCSHKSRGFKLSWKFQASGCNETIRVSSGVIMSPSLRNSNKSALHCNWRIIVNPGNSIRLAFLEFWAINVLLASCDEDYVEIANIDGQDISKNRYCYARAPPGTIYTTSNEAVISLVMSAMDYKGIALNLRFNAVCTRSLSGYKGTIESINYPHVLPPNLHCRWTINAWNNGSAFINLTNVNLNTVYNSLKIFEPERDASLGELGCMTDEKAIYEKPATCTSSGKTVLTELKTSIQMFRIGTGFRLEWEIVGCNKIVRSRHGIIQSTRYPDRYPVSDACEWKIATESGFGVELTIHEFDIENSTDCKFDGLKVFAGPPHVSQPILHLCGTSQYPSILASHLNVMYVQFYSDDSLSFKGFNASFKQITTSKNVTCGEDHFGSTGFLYSPNFPSPYNNFDNCRWTISVHDNYLVALKFLEIDIQGYGCRSDNLTVYYDKAKIGETPNKTLCGNQISRDVVSSNNVMTVTFQTDRIFVYKGFKSMFYEACGAKLNRDSGIIQNPTFLSMMNGADNCNWTIIASPSQSRVVLLFTDFYWPVADLNCNHHYIEVLAETEGNAPLYKGCCSHVPPVSISKGNMLILRTTNAKDLTFKAFYFTVTEACLHILRTSPPSPVVNGLIQFPTEEAKRACQQTLNVTAENKQINIQFQLYQPKVAKVHGKFCMTNFVAVHKSGFSELPIHIACPQEGIPTIENVSSYYWTIYINLDGTSDSGVLIGTGKNTSFPLENDLPSSGTATAGNAIDIAVFMIFLCLTVG